MRFMVKWIKRLEEINMNDKQLILNTVQNIDDKTSYEEILYTLYTQLEIQKGLKDMEEGNTKTSKQVKEIIDKW